MWRWLKPATLHPGFAQGLAVALGHAGAADIVVEQEDLDARLGALDQPFGQLLAQGVVAHDIKLHQQMMAGLLDAGKDGIEGGLAVDEDLDVVAGEKREFGNLGLHRPEMAGFAVDQRQILGAQRAGGAAIADAVGGVVVKGLPAEHHVEKGGREGQKPQRQEPGDRALGGARVHDFAHGADKGQRVDGNGDAGQDVQIRDDRAQDIVEADQCNRQI